MLLRAEHHLPSLMTTLRSFSLSTSLTDVTLVSGRQRANLHWPVLAGFTSLPREGTVVLLEELDTAVIRAILDYVYTGTADIPRAHVLELYRTAKMLGMDAFPQFDSLNDTTASHFSWPGHHDILMHKLWQARVEPRMCDVLLVAGDLHKARAHACVLGACSHRLLDLLERRRPQTAPWMHHVFVLHGVAGQILELVLEFCYKGEVEVSEEDMQSVYNASILLGIQRLSDELRALCPDLEEGIGKILADQTRKALPEQQHQGIRKISADEARQEKHQITGKVLTDQARNEQHQGISKILVDQTREENHDQQDESIGKTLLETSGEEYQGDCKTLLKHSRQEKPQQQFESIGKILLQCTGEQNQNTKTLTKNCGEQHQNIGKTLQGKGKHEIIRQPFRTVDHPCQKEERFQSRSDAGTCPENQGPKLRSSVRTSFNKVSQEESIRTTPHERDLHLRRDIDGESQVYIEEHGGDGCVVSHQYHSTIRTSLPQSPQNLHILSSFLHQESLADLLIVAGEEMLEAHAVVLTAFSPLFRNLVETLGQAMRNTVLLVSEQQAPLARALVDYVYKGETSFPGTVEDFCQAVMPWLDLDLLPVSLETSMCILVNDELKDTVVSSEGLEPDDDKQDLQLAIIDTESRENWQSCDQPDEGRPTSPPLRMRCSPRGSGGLKCYTCEQTFSSRQSLREHLTVHPEGRTLHCRFCSKTFAKPSQMKLHLRTHTGDRPFPCEQCGASFAAKSALTKHQDTHASERSRTFTCDVCLKAFSRKEYLEEHLRTHSGSKPFACPDCPKRFVGRTGLNHHRKTHAAADQKKSAVCEVCGKSFTRHALWTHVKSHDKSHACHLCSRPFATTTALKLHVAGVHLGHRWHQCEVCGKGFVQKYHLLRHGKVHDREAREEAFSCDKCGRAFGTESRRDAHLRTEHGEPGYACDICHKRFAGRSTVIYHRRAHTGERPHRCGQCGKTFTRPDTLRQHQRAHGDIGTERLQAATPQHQKTHKGDTVASPDTLHQHQRVHRDTSAARLGMAMLQHQEPLKGDTITTHNTLCHTTEATVDTAEAIVKPEILLQCVKDNVTRSNTSRQHQQVHSRGQPGKLAQAQKARPFRCEVPACRKSFRYQDSLDRHARVHTPGVPLATTSSPDQDLYTDSSAVALSDKDTLYQESPAIPSSTTNCGGNSYEESASIPSSNIDCGCSHYQESSVTPSNAAASHSHFQEGPTDSGRKQFRYQDTPEDLPCLYSLEELGGIVCEDKRSGRPYSITMDGSLCCNIPVAEELALIPPADPTLGSSQPQLNLLDPQQAPATTHAELQPVPLPSAKDVTYPPILSKTFSL